MNQDEILAQFNKWWNEDDDIPNDAPWQQDSMIQFAWAGYNAAIQHYKDSVLKEVGEPIAYRFELKASEYGFTQAKYACNVKYAANPIALFTSDQVAAAIVKAEQRIAELEAENERLKAECDNVKQVQFPRKLEAVAAGWKAKLAASQLHETQLIELIKRAHEFVRDDLCNDGLSSLMEALSLPTDTSALDAYVSEKVKVAEEQTGNKSPCYQIARDMAVRIWERHYKAEAPNWVPLDDFMGVLSQISNMVAGLGNVATLTRQRDLAVEALEDCKIYIQDTGQPLHIYRRVADTLYAIKESEVK